MAHTTLPVISGGGGEAEFVNTADGDLDMDGNRIIGLGTAVSAVKTAAYTATAADDTILMDTSAEAFDVTLPLAASLPGKIYAVRKVDSGFNVTRVVPTDTDTVNDTTSKSFGAQHECFLFQSDGVSNWFLIAKYTNF